MTCTEEMNLLDLPDDILCSIAHCVADPDREVDDIARDCASLALVSRSFGTIASSAWRALGKVAEAGPPVHTYRRSWGCLYPSKGLLKRELSGLATGVGCRKSVTLTEMKARLCSSEHVGPWCHLPRRAALYIREISASVVSLDDPPSAFREKDLALCPRRERARVAKLRDARLAPSRVSGTKDRIQQLNDLDQAFRSRNFIRQWGEFDLERRARVEDARTWCAEQSLSDELTQTVLHRAERNMEQSRDLVQTVAQVFAYAEVPTPYIAPTLRWSLRTAFRSALYEGLQRKYLGFSLFRLESRMFPSIDANSVAVLKDELIAHSVLRKAFCEAILEFSVSDRSRAVGFVAMSNTIGEANASMLQFVER